MRRARDIQRRQVQAIAGWGLRPTTSRPREIAQALGLPFIALEDGFLRSYGTGATHPPLSLVVDSVGIYYDATRPSALEQLLASDTNVFSGPGADHERAWQCLAQARLSKYNHSPDLDTLPNAQDGRPRVLVVDQTRGDMSIHYGLAGDDTFAAMLDAARRENPDAVIYVKTHPEVSGGIKQGYYDDLPADERTVLLRSPVHPPSLLQHMDRVYVVTSHMGFEALLAGIPVSCFGMPWYAGWGVTDDRVSCARRSRQRSVAELFAAAYLHYTRYLNPETHEAGTIFDVIQWLTRQRHMARLMAGRSIAIGYRQWKADNVRPFLGLDADQVHFVADADEAARLQPGPQDRLITWGADPAAPIQALARRAGARLLRMEDGFVRSVGLGSDFIAPLSLVLDSQGLYFDPRQPSDLETLLNTHHFTEDDRIRAARVRQMMVDHGITKYNVEPQDTAPWRQTNRTVVLVPGQVEDDASIRHGCGTMRTNLGLLREARASRPDAFIVYKPHPDVMARNRAGEVHRKAALHYADVIETRLSIVSCLAACDEVHTMTSLVGFDALLREKPVTVYGRPFYAGWGLTHDRLEIARRTRQLTLDELVAGALLHYPLYWDWQLNGYTTCEAVIRQIVRQRQALLSNGGLIPGRKKFLQRQWRKVRLWAKAGFTIRR